MKETFKNHRVKAVLIASGGLLFLLICLWYIYPLPLLQSALGFRQNESLGAINTLREGEEASSIETTEEDEVIILKADFEVTVPETYMGRDFDPFQFAKENAPLDSLIPRSTEAIVRDVHHMTHGAIVAKEKWGYLTLNDENIFTLLTELSAVENQKPVERRMINMLSNWYHGDVASIDEDHNFLWDWEGGTIGKASGMDWNGVEEDILQRAIQNDYKP